MVQSRGVLVWGRLRVGIPMVYLAQERNSLGEKCTVVTQDRQRMVGCCYQQQDTIRKW